MRIENLLVRIFHVALTGILPLALLMTGCGGSQQSSGSTSTATVAAPQGLASLPGVLHGGQAAIGGATMMLYAAGIPPSVAPTTLDTVTTDSQGNFTFSYTCPSPTALIYVVASGGNAGGGANPAIKLMAAVGACGSLPPSIVVNELTTVAAVYALNAFSAQSNASGQGELGGCVDCLPGFDGDMTQLHGNSPAINNAFATAGLLVTAADGTPAASLPSAISCTAAGPPVNCSAVGRLTALGNSLAACVNSANGSTQCKILFSATTASDTLGATLAIARNPGLVNIAAIYRLSTPNKVFSPGLTAVPTDWTLALNITGGGLNKPQGIAIDASGNVWVANSASNAGVTELSPIGTVLSPPGGFTGGGLNGPVAVAIDQSGNVWAANGGSVAELTPAGSPLSPAAGFSGGGLHVSTAIAIDGSGNVWVTNQSENVAEFNASGSPLSPEYGFGGVFQPDGIAIDGYGDVWVASFGGGVSELSATGSPLSSNRGAINFVTAIAIDGNGNIWTTSPGTVSELSTAGSVLSPVSGFGGGGLNSSLGIAIDGAGNVWVANQGSGVTELGSTGAPLSPASGFTGGGLANQYALAIDGGGNVWVTNYSTNSVTEIIGAAAPTVTPLVAQIAKPAAALATLAVTPASASITDGNVQQFAATATYTDNSTRTVTGQVTWTSASPAVATITNAGVASCLTPGTVTLDANFAQHGITAPTASAVLSCNAPVVSVVSIEVSPASVAIAASAQQQFSATGVNSDGTTSVPAVTWSVTGGAAYGAVTQGGLYTAPNAAVIATVVATSTVNPSVVGSAQVTVAAPLPVTVQVNPPTATLPAGGQQQFTATVGNDANPTVVWSIDEAAGGSVNAAGLYTAPGLAGTFHVRATSANTPGDFAEATVTVIAATTGLACNAAPSPKGGGALPYLNQAYCATFSGETDGLYTFNGTLTFTTPLTAPTSLTPVSISGCQFASTGTVTTGGTTTPASSGPTACTGTVDINGNLVIQDALTNGFNGVFATGGATVAGTFSFGEYGPGGGVASGGFTGNQQ